MSLARPQTPPRRYTRLRRNEAHAPVACVFFNSISMQPSCCAHARVVGGGELNRERPSAVSTPALTTAQYHRPNAG
jgi:hypothetical protein